MKLLNFLFFPTQQLERLRKNKPGMEVGMCPGRGNNCINLLLQTKPIFTGTDTQVCYKQKRKQRGRQRDRRKKRKKRKAKCFRY